MVRFPYGGATFDAAVEHTRALLRACRAAGAALRDVVLTRDEMAGLMANLFVSARAPAGRRRFRDWIARHRETLGQTYASELARHFRARGRPA